MILTAKSLVETEYGDVPRSKFIRNYGSGSSVPPRAAAAMTESGNWNEFENLNKLPLSFKR